jgi:hypothetical protein
MAAFAALSPTFRVGLIRSIGMISTRRPMDPAARH